MLGHNRRPAGIFTVATLPGFFLTFVGGVANRATEIKNQGRIHFFSRLFLRLSSSAAQAL